MADTRQTPSLLSIPSFEEGRTFRPMHGHVLLERIRERRVGALFLPDLGREHRERTVGQAVYARVLAVGSGRWLKKAQARTVPLVKPGDVVIVPALVGRGATNWGDEDRWVLPDEGIYAVVEEGAPEEEPRRPFAA